jgi:molybdopterin-synthase adenylyltransferase
MDTLADRDLRQRQIVPPEALSACGALVVGVGAIGRQVALQLAGLGMPVLELVDFDTVEVVNLASQGYWPADLRKLKVDATADLCRCINPQVQVHTHAQRFARSMVQRLKTTTCRQVVVFACVDSMSARRLIHQVMAPQAALLIDGRMSSEIVRVVSIPSPATDSTYLTTLFDDAQAITGTCTARSTLYTASIAAGLMLSSFTRWLRNLPVQEDLLINLLDV